MNNNREPNQCPRELLRRWVELTAMLYFGQGNRNQLQSELNELMSRARLIGPFKQRLITARSDQNQGTGRADSDASNAHAIRARGMGIRLE